jgi:uncharacterized phage-associated protein
MTASKKKLANTVLFILRGCAQHNPGVTALVKLLFLADSEHYRQHLRQITSGKYVALDNGPVLQDYQERLAELQAEGVVDLVEIPLEGVPRSKQQYIPKREADESAFTESELRILQEVIRQHGSKSGAELIRYTHQTGPWAFIWDGSEQGRPIPPVAFRWQDNLPDEADVAAARVLLAESGAAAALKSLQS